MGFGLRIPAHHGHQCQKVSYCRLAQLLQTCFCSVWSHLPHQQNFPWLLVSVCGTPAGIPRKEKRNRTPARHHLWIISSGERTWNPRKLPAGQANKAGTNRWLFPGVRETWAQLRIYISGTLVRKREYTRRWHFWKMAFTNRPQSLFCLQKNMWDHSSM